MKRGNHFSEKGSDFKFLATANELQFDIRSEEWSNGGFRQAERKNIPPSLGLNPSQSIIDVFKRFCHFGLYYLKQFALLKGYCGSVGRAFASNTRGPSWRVLVRFVGTYLELTTDCAVGQLFICFLTPITRFRGGH